MPFELPEERANDSESEVQGKESKPQALLQPAAVPNFPIGHYALPDSTFPSVPLLVTKTRIKSANAFLLTLMNYLSLLQSHCLHGVCSKLSRSVCELLNDT